jgi:glycosyltransferase involved in cell wall biosynthesis
LFNLQFATFGSGKTAAAMGLTAPALVKAAGYSTVVLLHNIMETVDLDSAGFADNRLMSTLIRAFGNITTRLLLRADLVALTIPKYVEILESKYKAENVILAPHGTFETPPMPDFELPEGPMRVMTFGKFGTYKKVEELIEATDMLRSNGHSDVELVIAGSDSPNTPGYLEKAAQVYEDVGGVTFTGYVPEEDVPRIFSESAVVVFPYTSTTGSSGVLHQAGGYGKAVVLPNIGDLSELITEEGYVGEFFEPASAESLRNAIARVLDNPERRVQMGRQNYLASCGLPIADVVDWYVLHMQELIKNKEG